MKKIILFAVTISLLLVSCSPKSGITGTFTGLTNDTLLIVINVLNDEYRFNRERMDTIIVRDGQFFYDPQTNILTKLLILPLGNINRLPGGLFSHPPGAAMNLLYSPGDRIRLDAINEDKVVAFHAKGNRYNELLSILNANTQDAYKQWNTADKVVKDPSFFGDKTVYREQRMEAIQIINNIELNYICNNPCDSLSAYLVASWFFSDYDKILQYTDSLCIEALNSVFGRILRQQTGIFREIKESHDGTESARKEMIGKPAPEFTLKDISGKDFSLHSLRGKYIVLDFWGSWCGFCLAAFPSIKKYYTAHSGEFEIVGISFADKQETWKMVVEKYALPWINVLDEDGLHDKYYVTSAPNYVLIDKEGIIVDFPQFDPDVMKLLNKLREERQL